MATAFSFAQGLAPRLPAMNDAAAIAQNLVSIQAASTQQALSIEMMRRNAEAERIGGKQQRALADRVTAAGERQDRPQHRADAGRPAEGEGKPHDIGGDGAGRPALALEARLARQQRDFQDAEEIEPHQDDEHPGGHRQRFLPDPQQPADGGSAGAECDEDGRKAEDEGDGGRHQRAARAGFRRDTGVAAKILHRDAGHVAQVGRHQRQHARRQEGERPCPDRADIADIQRHSLRASAVNP